LTYAESGAGGGAVEAACCAEGSSDAGARLAVWALVVSTVQWVVRSWAGTLRRHRASPAARARDHAGRLRRFAWIDLVGFHPCTYRLHAAAGQGLPDRLRPIARQRIAVTHRNRDSSHE